MKKNTLYSIVAIFIASLSWQCGKKEPTPVVPPIVIAPVVPVRGVWITNVNSKVLYSNDSIKAAVKRCKQSGVNHIFAVMWNKGRTLYPSKVMQDTFGIPIESGLSGRDPLRELIDAAHADSIKVYAWMEYGFAADNSGQGEHILRLRPKWAALGRDGQIVTKNGFRWMNAFDPVVQNFMMSLLREVVTKYPDLDGIQGDDRLPALPSECGYNAAVVADYKAENNGAEPLDNKTDARWVDWRAARLNVFGKRIYTELKALRPSIKIAMSPSVFPFSKTEYLQDWPTWVREGYVDIISPQLYRYDFAGYKNELTKVVGQITTDKLDILSPGMLLKLGTYKPTETFLQSMIDENRAQGVKGETFFYYEGLAEQPTFFEKYARK